MIYMMIDTHCHISKEDYSNIEQVITSMGNNILITSGVDTKSNKEVLELVETYPNVYGTIGIHPENVNTVTEEDFTFIEENINNPKVVAIGEIGLDYYWVKDNKEKQKEVFVRQLLLAEKYKKAVVVHSRDAVQDTYNILKELNLSIPIDIHCYSSSLEMAREFTKIGCRLGIGGVLTFKNSDKLKEIVKEIDLKYLLLETDSPFLSPEPYRGSQNIPYNAYYVALKIVEIKGISLEEVLEVTTRNAVSQFDLKIDL